MTRFFAESKRTVKKKQNVRSSINSITTHKSLVTDEPRRQKKKINKIKSS